MVELGKIEKPEASTFSEKRKLYCVANIYPIEDAPEGFRKLVDTYWDEVVQQIRKVEAAGRISKIFCELITQTDKESLEMLSRINEKLTALIKQKQTEGVDLYPLEKKEIFGPFTDWGNCLQVVFTKEVFTKIYKLYQEYAEKRLSQILEVIDKNLGHAEAGLLIMKDEDRAKVQFPVDIEVFLITPPSYDDIVRWIRDKIMRTSEQKA